MQKGKWDSFSREQLINIFNKAKTYSDYEKIDTEYLLNKINGVKENA